MPPLAAGLGEGGRRGGHRGPCPSLLEWRGWGPRISSWPLVPSWWLFSPSCWARAGWAAPRTPGWALRHAAGGAGGALGAPDAVVGATALRGGRGSHRHHGLPLAGVTWGQGRRSGPRPGLPTPPEASPGSPRWWWRGPEHSSWGPGILTRVQVDVYQSAAVSRAPMRKAPKVMPSTAGRTRPLSAQPRAGQLWSALPPPPCPPTLLCWPGAQASLPVSAQLLTLTSLNPSFLT